ncbi:MBL fold metallo-hydrolase [uncultured Sphaerochaeta sp.]|uniref:MBL fold metallo-hydrolase n=1 Tax=uncultured Sphaerochaeta sp. TaxID=886478 RepID=UPI002A0A9DC4|nr:MBL fold metallo-hydrolase [uncultured Sphaerochaeta sp.]
MFVECVVVGPYQTNCYIMGNEETSSAWIIDPGNEGETIIARLKAHDVTPVATLLTHSHWDHITALAALKKEWPLLEVLVSEEDSVFLGKEAFKRFCDTCFDMTFLQQYKNELEQLPPATGFLSDGQFLQDSHLRVLKTPGHTPGGVCLYHEEGQFLFSGDTLFAGSIGRTDLVGGSYSQIIESCHKLLTLPPEVQVLPGHGPMTTIGSELDNPYL